MFSKADLQVLRDELFAAEAEGVRFAHGPQAGEVTVSYIEDHYVHGVVFENKTYGDFVRHSAVEWLYNYYLRSEREKAELKEQVAQLKQEIFGTSSEQSSSKAADESAPPAQPYLATEESNVIPLPKERQPRNAGRKPLPDRLPREQKSHVASVCPCCHGSSLHVIGEEATEQLTIVPMLVKVIRHLRKKYRCKHCDKVFTAEGPKHLIEKSSYASPDFLAHIACSKYQFGLPLYRQENIFKQMGVPINRTTLANLMIGCADKLVALYSAYRDELLRQPLIHADETPFQVLKEPGRKATAKSWLWLYRSGETAQRQIVIFEYQPTRAGAHPRQFLDIDGERPYTGALQTDAYAAYKDLPGIRRGGCMGHARRRFINFIRLLPNGINNVPAHYAVELIGKLYGVERRIKGLPDRERQRIRQAESMPILLEFKGWLDEMEPKVTPKSALGKAIRYALDEWTAIVRYVDDGRMAIDNNIAERDIKSVVIGRKNWLFADSVAGAHTNAIMYSLIETAKANGLNPFDYLKYVIETMPTLRTSAELDSLLPWNMPTESAEDRIAA